MESFHDFLKRIKLFADLSEQEIDEILRLTNRMRIKAGTLICQEGDFGQSMYVIREGVVRVERQSASKTPLKLARMSEGMVIGEMALVDDQPRSATLVAETDCILYEIQRIDFEDFKAEQHPAAYKLLRAIAFDCCERLRSVNQQIKTYTENPKALFEPDVTLGLRAEEITLTKRLKGFLRLFGATD